MIEFPQDKYGSNFIASLWHYRYDKTLSKQDQKDLDLLYKLIQTKAYSSKKGESVWELRLTEEEQKIIENNNWTTSANLEVKTKSLDATLRLATVNKQYAAKNLSQLYTTLYEKTASSDFVIRAFELLSTFHINDDTMANELLEKIYRLSSYWFVSFSKILYKTTIIQDKQSCIDKINKLRILSVANNRFDHERNYIELKFPTPIT